MGKDKNPRRVAENEAMAKVRMLRTSPQKLNLVAGLIRGKKVDKALSDLTFSKKRIAEDVKKCLQSAIANAENNHNLDVDELVVAEAYVGKNLIMKRGKPRARGRFGRIIKPFSELTIKVRQVEETSLMGQKVNPIGMRLQVNRTWDSRWYADTKDYGDLLLEDLKIREFIKDECKQAGVSRVIIERPHKQVPGHDPHRASRGHHRQEGRGYRGAAQEARHDDRLANCTSTSSKCASPNLTPSWSAKASPSSWNAGSASAAP